MGEAHDAPVANVTSYGYDMTMKQVRIAELKARLSEHLRAVRRGQTVTVLDRDQPIARIVPYRKAAGDLDLRKPKPGSRLARVRLPPPLKLKFDIVDLLLEERQRER